MEQAALLILLTILFHGCSAIFALMENLHLSYPSTAAAPDDVSLFRRLPTNRSHSSGLCVTADGFTLEKSLTAILWSSVDSFHNEICFSVELYKYKG